MNRLFTLTLLFATISAIAKAQSAGSEPIDSTQILNGNSLDEVEVTARRKGTMRMGGAINGTIINKEELFKAACCNLGESFVTNPSVDVSYNDALAGARQIKLLGLSGIYVQMLTENIPNFRGAATPYALGYVPGPWMKSIQVSKGCASVKNGYESITGQINIEYIKPDDDEGATANMYADSKNRIEANADANLHVAEGLSSEILAHYENRWGHHDGNADGFQDLPSITQVNVQNRWKYVLGRYMLHAGLSLIDEERSGGQTPHAVVSGTERYTTQIDSRRYEAYMKHAYSLDKASNASLALIASASMHRQDARYGIKTYAVNEKNVYAQMLFESDVAEVHNIAAGLSINHDYLGQDYNLGDESLPCDERETVEGAYVQYTFNWQSHFTAMAGLRADHSSIYGTFITPRMHIKWQPCDVFSLRMSAGKGYRSPHVLAENNYLLASGRTLVIGETGQEEAWNAGLSTALNIPLGNRSMTLNAEYYYTTFSRQTDVDYSTPGVIVIADVEGRSYSHTLQIDASYELFKGMLLTAAFRRNIVKSTYGGVRSDKPLTSKYKGLVTASFKTPLGLWQIDATLQLNGSGRMPTPYERSDGSLSWPERFHAYEQLSAQVTRWFRHFSIYIGGENLTGQRQKTSVYGADDPWSSSFEPTMLWGPVHGAMFYAGVRVNIGRL